MNPRIHIAADRNRRRPYPSLHGRLAPAGMLAVLCGCAAPPAPVERNEALSADAACRRLSEDLFGGLSQVDRIRLLAESKIARKTLTVAPMVDLNTGDQDASMRACDGVIAATLPSAQSLFEVRPWGIDEFARASYAVVPSSEVAGAGSGRTNLRLRAVLLDTKNGKVLARASAVASTAGASRVPTPFYRDSPVLVRDEFLASHQATLRAAAGEGVHPRLLQDLRVRAQQALPIDMYNRERYPDALREFKQVAASPQGDTLTSQVGIYVAGSQVGAEQDVARASERIVDKGIEARRMEFKIFFRPDSVTPYAKPPFDTMRLIPGAANKIASTNLCLNVIGHTSRTGTAAYNLALSMKRAEFIKEQMSRVNPAGRSRITAIGKGFEDNVIGNGADDDSDLVDRRVEFVVRNC